MSAHDRDVTVYWEVEDGYVGGSRPHRTVIDREEWDEAAEEGQDALDALIHDYIQEDFANKIAWHRTGDPEVPA